MLQVKKRNGRLMPLDVEKINCSVQRACEGLTNVSVSEIVLDAQLEFFDKITTREIDDALIMCARNKVDKEPNYSYAAARLLLNTIYKEVFGEGADSDTFELQYRKSFISNLKQLVKAERLDPRLIVLFDLKALSHALNLERDSLLKCMGAQILYDRYFQHIEGVRKETPQAFWMRVAMGLALAEKDKHTERAIEFYERLSSLEVVPSTPTLFNAGTTSAQMSSCYLSQFGDSIHGIFRGMHQQAMLSKHAGGLGVDVTPLRGTNSYIKKTNGISSGLIPWVKILGDTALAVNQAGLRKGACAVYLQTWHVDIEDYLDLRKPVGDDRRRTLDLNTVNYIPDEFMRRVEADSVWTLLCPNEVPELISAYGDDFTKLYLEAEARGEAGELRVFKQISARDLWKRMLGSQLQFGGPWQVFKDTVNYRNPIPNVGAIHSSNLCCVTADQRASTQWGLLTVSELSDRQGQLKVPGRTKIELATNITLTIKNSPVVCVTTKEGYSHKVTPDHPLWKVTSQSSGWEEAQNLRPGDKIEIQQIEGCWGPEHFPEEAFIMGLVAGDGTYGENETSVCIDLWAKDAHLIPELEKSVSNVIARNSAEARTGAKTEPKFSAKQPRYRLSSRMLGQSLQAYGLHKSTKVSVPDRLWKANRQTIAEYLRGVFLADGTVQYDDGPTKVCSFSLTSTHRKFLTDLQVILANFGIPCTVTNNHAAGEKSLPDGKGGHAMYACNQSWRLLVTCRRDCLILDELTGIFSSRGLKITSKKAIYNPQKVAHVESVTIMPNEDVYCLTVDSKDHAWVCNGLVTKNTEVTLPTQPSVYDEITGNTVQDGLVAVCNISNINLKLFVAYDADLNKMVINWAAMREAIRTQIRMLDNVIDENYYPVPEARKANLYSRPIICSQLGWHDMLLALDINYNSREMVALASRVQEFIYFQAVEASMELARERGAFPAFKGSLWSQGIFAQDTYVQWAKSVGQEPKYLPENFTSPIPCWELNWEELRSKVVEYGIRNSNITCNAPTATVSYIAGSSQSFEPYFQVIYTYSTLSGEILSVCEAFYEDIKARGLFTPELLQELRMCNGDVAETSLPDDLKAKYASPYNIPYELMIDANAARQVHVDQAQSFNLFSTNQSLKYHHDMFMYAWKAGLKSTYYLRSKAATNIKTLESTVQQQTQPQTSGPNPVYVPPPVRSTNPLHETMGAESTLTDQQLAAIACSIANPEACEACQ